MRALLVFVVLAGSLLAGTSVARDRIFNSRMYNLSTGEVISAVSTVDRSGHSTITAGPTKSGETFSGEATTIDNRIRSSTSTNGIVSTPGVLTDSYITASSYSTTTPGYQNGTAILVGSQGTVIDILYRVSLSGSGEGEGKDNKGVNYRIQFSQQR